MTYLIIILGLFSFSCQPCRLNREQAAFECQNVEYKDFEACIDQREWVNLYKCRRNQNDDSNNGQMNLGGKL